MNTCEYNLEDFEETGYNEFEAESNANVPEMASINSTGPTTGTGTSSSTGRRPKRVLDTFSTSSIH